MPLTPGNSDSKKIAVNYANQGKQPGRKSYTEQNSSELCRSNQVPMTKSHTKNIAVSYATQARQRLRQKKVARNYANQDKQPSPKAMNYANEGRHPCPKVTQKHSSELCH